MNDFTDFGNKPKLTTKQKFIFGCVLGFAILFTFGIVGGVLQDRSTHQSKLMTDAQYAWDNMSVVERDEACRNVLGTLDNLGEEATLEILIISTEGDDDLAREALAVFKRECD